jgi:hypothetical protein
MVSMKLICVFFACALAVATASCTKDHVQFGGDDTNVDVAIVFEQSAPKQTVSDFISESLSENSDDGRPGRALLPGIQGVSADYSKRVVYVTLEPSASGAEEETVVKIASDNDQVERVLRDVSPSEIPD